MPMLAHWTKLRRPNTGCQHWANVSAYFGPALVQCWCAVWVTLTHLPMGGYINIGPFEVRFVSISLEHFFLYFPHRWKFCQILGQSVKKLALVTEICVWLYYSFCLQSPWSEAPWTPSAKAEFSMYLPSAALCTPSAISSDLVDPQLENSIIRKENESPRFKKPFTPTPGLHHSLKQPEQISHICNENNFKVPLLVTPIVCIHSPFPVPSTPTAPFGNSSFSVPLTPNMIKLCSER